MKAPPGRDQPVMHPQSVLACCDESRPTKIRQVARHFCLRLFQGRHDVAHADFIARRQQVENAKPGAVRKRPEELVDRRGSGRTLHIFA